MSSIKYRPDIDGLRAIAVLAVILYHGELALPGGFLGVDIFFVISGYLISKILIAEYEANQRISIKCFYERRIRRILPALCVVCIVSTPFAYFLMLPESFSSFLQSLLASQVFASNIFFWNETGYFAAAAETKPLIHTWSLSVEEQYYLFFPMAFAYVMTKWSQRGLLYFSLVSCVLSLLLAAWGVENMRSAAFYLTPFRIWELFAGVIAAISGERLAEKYKGNSFFLSLLGVFLIAAPLLIYSALDTYPVPFMLAIVIGAMLVIVYGPQTIVGTTLSIRPLTFIGKISYSAYLMHQPVFVFARLYFPSDLSPLFDGALAILSLALGWVSWRVIEQPFRQGLKFSGERLFKTAAISVLTICVVAIAGLWFKPPSQWSAEALAYGSKTSAGTYGLSPKCSHDWTLPECAVGADPKVLLWGDSYAMHLAPGLQAQGVSFRQAALPSCPPRAHPSFVPPTGNSYAKACKNFNNKVIEYLGAQAKSGQITAVILSARDYGARGGALRRFPKEESVDVGATFTQLNATIEALQQLGLSVGVVGAPPATTFDPAQCSLKVLAFGHPPERCQFPLLESAAGRQAGAITTATGAVYLDVAKEICNNTVCDPVRRNILLYRDNGHLVPEGARWLFNSEHGVQFIQALNLKGSLS